MEEVASFIGEFTCKPEDPIIGPILAAGSAVIIGHLETRKPTFAAIVDDSPAGKLFD